MSQNQYLYQRYTDISRFVIWGEEQDNSNPDQRRPKLTLGFRDGNPRFVVNTGVMGLGGMINFPTDIPTMTYILVKLKDIAEGDPGSKISIDSLTTVYSDNKPTNEKKVVSKLYIGKSKEGLVYLSVIAEGKPKLVFTIKSSPYHVFRDKDNNQIAEAETSKILTLGIANMMLNVISMFVLQYTHEEYLYSGRKQATTNKNAAINTGSAYKPKQPERVVIDDLDDLAI